MPPPRARAGTTFAPKASMNGLLVLGLADLVQSRSGRTRGREYSPSHAVWRPGSAETGAAAAHVLGRHVPCRRLELLGQRPGPRPGLGSNTLLRHWSWATARAVSSSAA